VFGGHRNGVPAQRLLTRQPLYRERGEHCGNVPDDPRCGVGRGRTPAEPVAT
jgi:hypothetical protein